LVRLDKTGNAAKFDGRTEQPLAQGGGADALRALSPRPPAPSRALQQERAAQQSRYDMRARMEQRSVLRGLILLAMLALLAGIARAGLDRVFVHGWWRQW
jgi:hypothetical protein